MYSLSCACKRSINPQHSNRRLVSEALRSINKQKASSVSIDVVFTLQKVILADNKLLVIGSSDLHLVNVAEICVSVSADLWRRFVNVNLYVLRYLI